MSTEDKRRTAHRALVARVLDGDAHAPRTLRRAAFDNTNLDEPLRTLIEKVAKHAYRVTDADIVAVNASGLSEDQIFEVVVCAAVGQATRQHDTALTVLADAMADNRGPSMRLEILNSGYSLGTKTLFALIHAVTRQPVPDAAKLVFYRPDFYGARHKELTHEAMRGPSEWSIGDRELMAAFVSKMNECQFCIAAHTAVAARAYEDTTKVAAVMSDLETAPLQEPLRATLRMLRKLTLAHAVDTNDMRTVLAAGVSRQQIEDALAVCLAFNITDRLADAFEFAVLDPEGFDAGARYLLKRGYR